MDFLQLYVRPSNIDNGSLMFRDARRFEEAKRVAGLLGYDTTSNTGVNKFIRIIYPYIAKDQTYKGEAIPDINARFDAFLRLVPTLPAAAVPRNDFEVAKLVSTSIFEKVGDEWKKRAVPIISPNYRADAEARAAKAAEMRAQAEAMAEAAKAEQALLAARAAETRTAAARPTIPGGIPGAAVRGIPPGPSAELAEPLGMRPPLAPEKEPQDPYVDRELTEEEQAELDAREEYENMERDRLREEDEEVKSARAERIARMEPIKNAEDYYEELVLVAEHLRGAPESKAVEAFAEKLAESVTDTAQLFPPETHEKRGDLTFDKVTNEPISEAAAAADKLLSPKGIETLNRTMQRNPRYVKKFFDKYASQLEMMLIKGELTQSEYSAIMIVLDQKRGLAAINDMKSKLRMADDGFIAKRKVIRQ